MIMKKFLSAILFLMFAGVASAQCIDIKVTPTAGTCYSDAQLKVEAKPVSPLPSGCPAPGSEGYFVRLEGYGTDSGLERMAGGTSGQYTFTSLNPGNYTVTVYDAKNGNSEAKSVKVISSYKIMNIQSLQAIAPACNKNNGGVKFKIPNGGIGPFEITLLDMSDQVLVPAQTFTRPTGNNYIEVRGNNSHKVLPNTFIKVKIKDITNVHNNCGEERILPKVQIPALQNDFSCIDIRISNRYLTRSRTDCNKYEVELRIKEVGQDRWLTQNPNITYSEIKSFFTQPGRAVVRFLNSSKPQVDISSTFDGYGFKLKFPSFIEKGDEVEIIIKGPNNTITERVRFNEQIVTPLCPRGDTFRTYNNSYKKNKPGSCGAFEQSLSLYHYLRAGDWRTLPNLDGGTYPYDVTWPVAPVDISQYKLEKSTTGNSAGPWVEIPMVSGTPGAGQARWTSNIIYLDKVGEGLYRLTYKDPMGCRGTCVREEYIKYIDKTTSNPIEKIWNYLKIGYGSYEGTGAFRFEEIGDNKFYYPLKFKIEPVDGTKSVTYQGKLALGSSVTRTITYPINYTNKGDIRNFGYTNLPSTNYRIIVTDACSNTTTRDYVLPAMRYNPILKYERDCEVGKII